MNEGSDSRVFTLRLHAVTHAATNTNLYEFVRPEGGPLPPYEPGAHLDVHMPGGVIRQYSLARPYRPDEGYLVGIKLDANTRGGSRYMYEEARAGSLFEVGGPRNHFPLPDDAAHTVLLAGGIGVTPIWCHAVHLTETGASFELHYAVRTRDEAMFVDEFEELGTRARLHVDAEAGGVLDVAAIVRAAPPSAHLVCCGPGPMMQVFEQAVDGWPTEQVHVEYFSGPAPTPIAGGFAVVLASSGHELVVAPGCTILETVRAAGVEVPTSCEQGVCGTCETRVLEGVPDHRDILLTPAEKESGETMMICCSGSLTPELVLDL